MPNDAFIEHTAEIVAAHVSNNTVRLQKIAGLIERVFAALSHAANPPVAPPVKVEPAVSIRASVKPDYIVCLEDGMKLKTMRRHLQSAHDMTPAEYRAKWDLPSDYPLVSSSYSEKRREVSLAQGLGRKREPEPIAEPAPAPAAKRGRPKKVSTGSAPAASPEAAVKPVRKLRAKKSSAASSR